VSLVRTAVRGASRELAVRDRAPAEHRDPTAATQTTTRYQSPGKAQIPEWDAAQAIQMAFYANVIVYRCMQILANTLAACPFRAGVELPPQPGGVVPFDAKARLAQLLGPPPGGPNPEMSARRLWAYTVIQRKLTGRHGWEVETTGPRGKGEVAALWPLGSAFLRAIPSTKGNRYFDSFEYGQLGDPNNVKSLAADQVMYGWDPGARDFREPESSLQAGRYAIAIATMMDRYSVGFLRNDARPAAVVVTEAFASDDDFRAFKSHWYGEYGGPDNAGKVSFVETDPEGQVKPSEALNVQILGLSQKDARFIEQNKAALEQIAIGCGIPWSKLDASGRTFDNAGEEDETFWFLTMLPLLSDLADEVNMRLAPRLGREVGWFDLSHVKVFQPQRRFVSMQDAAYALDHQVVTRNEVRVDVGLPPIDGGDEFDVLPAPVLPGQLALAASKPHDVRGLVHKHMHTHDDGTIHSHVHRHGAGVEEHGDFATVAHTHGHAASKAHGGVVARGGVFEVLGVGEEMVIGSDGRAVTVDGSGTPMVAERRETDEEARERRARLWRTTDAQVRALESRWTKSMRRLFAKQSKSVVSRLEGNRGRRAVEDANADELFDPGFWHDQTAEETQALYELVTAAGFARVAGQFGITFDLDSTFAQEFIGVRANQLAGQVTDTTYQAIKDALAEGVEAGESIPDLAARIRGVFELADTVRATLIARTETVSAFAGATRLAGDQLPSDVLDGYEWISTQDARTRDDHSEADGQIIGRDGAFDIGGEQLAYPGDPSGSPENVCNCRCAVAPVAAEAQQQAASTPQGHHRSPLAAAMAVLATTTPGQPFDELAIRRALRQETAA
jgi:HK97 family phage portal protein